MIGIINTETGNINSISNVLKKTGFNYLISKNYKDLTHCEKIIFPGVGNFDACMKNLKKNSLDQVVKTLITKDQKKILCICVGMQLLLNYSEEGDSEGLGIIDGYCKKFLKNEVNNVPHIGWAPIFSKHKIFEYNGDKNAKFYFCHSYHARIIDKEINTFSSNFNINFCAGFIKNNIVGVQFHPEKSLNVGTNFLKKFIINF